MKRRDFIVKVIGAAAIWPFAAVAQQQSRRARVGALYIGLADGESFKHELREGLRELTVSPLRVLFIVREEDRLVEVSKVRYLPSPPPPPRENGLVTPTE